MSDPTHETTKIVLEKWTPIAADVAETVPGVPVPVLNGEALDLAHFITEHWEPKNGKKPLPGLRTAVSSGGLTETAAQELLELVFAVGHAHAQYRAVTAATLDAPVERGEFLLSELKQSLEFIFDDGVTDEQDAEFARLSESHSDTSSHDTLANSLEGFAYYATRFRDRLSALPEFDQVFIDEALIVANRLREQSAIKLSSTALARQAQQLALRNRFITLMNDRMNRARRAARYVFRNHPETAKLVGSNYERRRRARTRAAKKEETVPESTSN